MSPMLRDFEIVQAQAVVFTPGGQIAMPRVLVALLKRWADVFNGEIVSIPGNAPTEFSQFPYIILHSADEQFGLEISGARAAVTWAQRDTKQAFDIEMFVDHAHKVLCSYLEAAPALAGRLALILHRIALTKEPAKTLVEHFCQERWFSAPVNRPENFELHAHKAFQMSDEFMVNSWIRCKTGIRPVSDDNQLSPELEPVILVEQDINTLNEAAGNIVFGEESMERFFHYASNEMEHILGLYFPGV